MGVRYSSAIPHGDKIFCGEKWQNFTRIMKTVVNILSDKNVCPRRNFQISSILKNTKAYLEVQWEPNITTSITFFEVFELTKILSDKIWIGGSFTKVLKATVKQKFHSMLPLLLFLKIICLYHFLDASAVHGKKYKKVPYKKFL